ncbi:MAG TPA: M20 family metallopeptidase [Thermomicrobiales bacterium]|jgi:succinyl-diaminopimelate desuccinylase|nr:M20 family metallopeptidase [Thermomicrobiales bacterium]
MHNETTRRVLVEAVDEPEVTQLCARLVQARSENPPGEEAEAAGIVADWCRKLGAAVTITEPVERRPNVIARFPGTGSAPGLAFSGHLDVVPVSHDERSRWERDPYGAEIADDELWGRGSVDMKGGVSAAMAAISALRGTGVELPGDLWLLASMDEEATMLGVKAMLADDALSGVGAAVVCEPTSLRVAHVCKGRTWATLRVLGQTAHASLKGAGVNAVAHGARLATALEGVTPIHQLHELAGESWWAVTEIEGGIEPAIIPDHCDLTLDVRLVPGQTCAGIWDEVQAVIDRLANEVLDFRCEVDVVECREPWEIDPESAVASAIAAGVRGATGRDAELFAFPGTTDASYLVPAGIPCVICGPGDLARTHRENEGVPIAELSAAARAYALTAVEFFASRSAD